MRSKYQVASLFLFLVTLLMSASRAQAMDQYTVFSRGQYADYLRYTKYSYTPSVLATAYPTLTPIGVPPTNQPLVTAVDLSCPAGVPAGYGTVTPSTDWLMACAQCLPTYTAQPFGTSTPGATHTPFGGGGTALPPICMTVPAGGEVCYTQTAPTSTPANTVTPFPTSTSLALTSTPNSGLLNFITASLGNTGSPYVNTPTGSYTSNPTISTPAGLYYLTGTVSAIDGNNVIGGTVKYDFHFDPLITSGSQIIYVTWSITNVIGGTGASAYNPLGTSTATGSTTFTNQYNSNRIVSIGASSSTTRNSGAFGATFELWVSTYPYTPYPTPTPSPSATPTSSLYCGSISNSAVPNQFQFSGGRVVYQSCTTTPYLSIQSLVDAVLPDWLSSFSSFFAGVFPTTTIFEPLTVCVRSRDYTLYIFGVRIPIEAFVGLIIFVSMVRMVNPAMSSLGGLIGSTANTSSSDYVVTSKSIKNPDGSTTTRVHRENK